MEGLQNFGGGFEHPKPPHGTPLSSLYTEGSAQNAHIQGANIQMLIIYTVVMNKLLIIYRVLIYRVLIIYRGIIYRKLIIYRVLIICIILIIYRGLI